VKEQLWQWARGHLARAVRRGLPEWYKAELMKAAFKEEHNA